MLQELVASLNLTKNSDLTVDFGFVASLMSIGNRVWIDDGADTTQPDNFNETQFDDGNPKWRRGRSC